MVYYVPIFGSCDNNNCLTRKADTPCKTNRLPKEDREKIEQWRTGATHEDPPVDAVCAERFFSEYCKERGVSCCPIPRSNNPSPDFLIYPKERRIAVEVKFKSCWGQDAQRKTQDWASTQVRNSGKQLHSRSEKGELTLLILIGDDNRIRDVVGSIVRHGRRVNFVGSDDEGSLSLSSEEDLYMKKSLKSVSAIVHMRCNPTMQGFYKYKGGGIVYPVGLAKNKWPPGIGEGLFEEDPRNGFYLGDTVWIRCPHPNQKGF